VMILERPRKIPAGNLLAGLLVAVLVAAWPAALRAQPNEAAKGELAEPYVDRSFAFSLVYPAGATIVREKRATGPNETELVRFVQEQYVWSLAVRLSQIDRPFDPNAAIGTIRDRLRTIDPQMTEQRADVERVGDRPIVRFEALLTSEDSTEDTRWLRQQAAIPTGDQAYYSLIMLCPTADQRSASQAFDKIVASFELLRSEQMQQMIDEALQRGANLLLSIAGQPQGLGLDEPVEAYFRVVRDGTETGFVHVQQAETTLADRHGAAVQEIAWLFNPDGSVTHTARSMFVADSLIFSKWDNRIRVLTRAANGSEHTVSVGAETGLRQGDKLLVAYSPKFNATRMQERVLQLEPSFAGPAFFALLPRLIDLDKPELYAFSAYDSDRRGLSLQTVEVTGGAQVVIEGQVRTAVRLRGSEGSLPPFDETFVDRDGRALKITTGAVEMTATTQQYIERRYRARVEESLALFEKYPIPWPEPPKP